MIYNNDQKKKKKLKEGFSKDENKMIAYGIVFVTIIGFLTDNI